MKKKGFGRKTCWHRFKQCIEKTDHQHLCQIFQIIPSTALWPVWSYSTKLIQCIYIVNLCSKILTDNLLRTRMKLHELSTNAGFVPPQHCVCSRMSSHTHAWSHGNITRKEKKMCDFGKMEKVLLLLFFCLLLLCLLFLLLLLFRCLCLLFLCLPLFLRWSTTDPSSSSLYLSTLFPRFSSWLAQWALRRWSHNTITAVRP